MTLSKESYTDPANSVFGGGGGGGVVSALDGVNNRFYYLVLLSLNGFGMIFR